MNRIVKLLSIPKNSSKEFWISHTIVLFATVIGVYLAASAGLQSALQFEIIKSDRDSYFLRSAMYDELKDNVEQMETMGTEFINGQSHKYLNHKGEFAIDLYVWGTMKFSPGTFEIPSRILTEVRRYYRLAELSVDKMTEPRFLGTTKTLIEKVLKENKHMTDVVLPLLRQDIDALKVRLLKQGVDVSAG